MAGHLAWLAVLFSDKLVCVLSDCVVPISTEVIFSMLLADLSSL